VNIKSYQFKRQFDVTIEKSRLDDSVSQGNNTPLLRGADRVDEARHVPMQETINQENDLLKNYLDQGRNKSIFDSQRIPNITLQEQKKTRRRVIKKVIMKKKFSSDVLYKKIGPGTQGSDKDNPMSHKLIPPVTSQIVSQPTSGKSIPAIERSTDEKSFQDEENTILLEKPKHVKKQSKFKTPNRVVIPSNSDQKSTEAQSAKPMTKTEELIAKSMAELDNLGTKRENES
jgi:hypothetical protein